MSTEPFRIDLLIEGALEWRVEHTNFGAAKLNFDEAIAEIAQTDPDKDWQLDLYDQRTEPPEVMETHHHEAESLYEVAFTVQVHAEDAESAEVNARDLLEQTLDSTPVEYVKVVGGNR